jgi:hypothetical protein
MAKWQIKYKEYGKDRISSCSHSDNKNQEEVIEFFGLNGPDVEWYKITKETDN